jgi:hypothetical protein
MEMKKISISAKRQVRPAVEAMIKEAEHVATLESGYESYEDIFGEKEKKHIKCMNH